MVNTHVAVINDHPNLTLIASGDEEQCRTWLASYLTKHPLTEHQRGEVLTRESAVVRNELVAGFQSARENGLTAEEVFLRESLEALDAASPTAPISISKRHRADDRSSIETVIETTGDPSPHLRYTEQEMKLLTEGLLALRFWTADFANHRQTPDAQRRRHALDALLVKMGADQDQLDVLDRTDLVQS